MHPVRNSDAVYGAEAGIPSGRAGYDLNQLPDVGLIERIEVLKGAGEYFDFTINSTILGDATIQYEIARAIFLCKTWFVRFGIDFEGQNQLYHL